MIHKDFLDRISQSFDLCLIYNGDNAVLSDRQSGAFIELSEDEYYTNDKREETFFEYTVCFSTQHRHFDSLDKVEEYIRSILSDELLPIEFYKSDCARFGSEISKDDFDRVSVDKLAQMFGYTAEYLSQFEFEIHSWSGKYDRKRTKVSELSKEQ